MMLLHSWTVLNIYKKRAAVKKHCITICGFPKQTGFDCFDANNPISRMADDDGIESKHFLSQTIFQNALLFSFPAPLFCDALAKPTAIKSNKILHCILSTELTIIDLRNRVSSGKW